MPLTIIESFTKAGLPAPGNAGRIARVSDEPQNIWMDTGQQWFGINGDVFNVKEFGAIGDSVTDDLPAFNAALAAMPTAGGKLIIPNGTYKLSAPFRINKRIILEGAGGPIDPAAGTRFNLAAGAYIVVESYTGNWSQLRNFTVFGTLPPAWAPNTVYPVGTIVRQFTPAIGAAGTGFIGSFTQMIYRCTAVAGTGTSGATPPAFT